MKKQEIGELCCKVLSIYAFIMAVSNAGVVLLSLTALSVGLRSTTQVSRATVHIFPLLPSLLLLCLSACLWLFAGNIARRMFHEEEESAVIFTGSTVDSIKRIAFIIAGILILIGALSRLTGSVASMLTGPRQMTIYSTVYLVEAVIRIAVGAWLILGSDRLCTFTKSAS